MPNMKYVVLEFSESLDKFVDAIAFSDPLVAIEIANNLDEAGAETFIEVINPDGTREEYVY